MNNDELFLVELIKDYRNEGLSRKAIANELDITFSETKRLIKKYTIPKPLKNEGMVAPVDSIPLEITYGIPLMEQAKSILGARLTEDYGGYRLDGMYSNTPAILEAAGLKVHDET